jgi:Tfp pilus assembly protein PilO
MNHSPSAITNLGRRIDRYLIAIAISIVFGIILTFIFYSLSRQEIKKIAVVKQEIATHNVSEENLLALNNFVNQNAVKIDTIFSVFPSESEIIPVLEEIEATVMQYDPAARVGFTAEQPSKPAGELQIPLRISLHSSISDLISLLRAIEKLPFIVEVISVELNTVDPANIQSIILARLYVNDPFVETVTNP